MEEEEEEEEVPEFDREQLIDRYHVSSASSVNISVHFYYKEITISSIGFS